MANMFHGCGGVDHVQALLRPRSRNPRFPGHRDKIWLAVPLSRCPLNAVPDFKIAHKTEKGLGEKNGFGVSRQLVWWGNGASKKKKEKRHTDVERPRQTPQPNQPKDCRRAAALVDTVCTSHVTRAAPCLNSTPNQPKKDGRTMRPEVRVARLPVRRASDSPGLLVRELDADKVEIQLKRPALRRRQSKQVAESTRVRAGMVLRVKERDGERRKREREREREREFDRGTIRTVAVLRN